MTRILLSVALAATFLVLPALPVLAGDHAGGRGTQGASPADPDGDSNGGEDKPDGQGSHDDRDGNNGCGNDGDFEDDNNGNCGGPRHRSSDGPAPDPARRELTPDAPSGPSDHGTADGASEAAGPVRSPKPGDSPEAPRGRAVLRLLAAMNAPQHRAIADDTLAALLQGVVAFLEQQQLSLGVPTIPRADLPTEGGIDVLGEVLTDGDDVVAGGRADDGTTATELLATAGGAVLLLLCLTIATLGVGSLLVRRSPY